MTCRHVKTVRISSHENLLDAAVNTGDAMASELCCDRPECQEKAIFRVQGLTGRTAVIKPVPRRSR